MARFTFSPHHGTPDDYLPELLDAGVDLASIGLDRLAWGESSRDKLDGLLTWGRVKRLVGYTGGRMASLVIAGAWRTSEAGVQLVRYLDANRSRNDIAELREKRAGAGSHGGQTTAEKLTRDDHGQYVKAAQDPREGDARPAQGKSEDEVEPGSDPAHAQESKQPTKHLPGPSTSSSTSTSRLASTEATSTSSTIDPESVERDETVTPQTFDTETVMMLTTRFPDGRCIDCGQSAATSDSSMVDIYGGVLRPKHLLGRCPQ